ncbi:MAG: glycosyltransferase family 2 protein [Candidatus Omnitrophota bacterium]|nr:glycosyltransferase family 2 protein [Candidatus Omnitrophota bacterium]
MTNISVVIPVYRSEGCLRELCRRLKDSLEKIADNFEIIMVEDCGGDGSWGVILELAGSDSRVKGIQLNRNFGQHNAILCGINQARYDIIVTMDDDLQHPPEEIAKLVNKLSEGYDVVYGIPAKLQHSSWRNSMTNITKFILLRTMDVKTIFNISPFRVFRSIFKETFSNYHGSFVSIDVLLSWGTSSFASVPVWHDQRLNGASNYSLRKLITHTFNIITGFSTFPLQLASLMGFVFTVFGISVLAYILGIYVIFGLGSKVPGFAFLASIVTIFSGVQLFTLGIIGEYISRIYFRVTQKPPYVVHALSDSLRRP